MIIENRDRLTILYAEGTNKLTNQSRTFYSDLVYLGINDSADNYEEVSKDVWKNFIKITDPNLEDVKESLKTIEDKVEANSETNLTQDELILTSMDALAESYEQTLVIEENTTENTENILISMDALAELYEMILTLQTELEILKGGDSDGKCDGDDLL